MVVMVGKAIDLWEGVTQVCLIDRELGCQGLGSKYLSLAYQKK